jgi:hypothetical protein
MLLLGWLMAHGLSGPVLEGFAYLLPALLLLGVLRTRRYPGERALVSIMAPPVPRPARESRGARPRAVSAGLLPRGGRLIGCALAVRPPPRAAASPS